MAVKAVLSFLVALSALVLFGGIALMAINTSRGRKARPGLLLLVIGLIGILVVAPLNAGLVLIQPNEVGVVFRQTSSGDAALRQPIEPGLSWVIPFVDDVKKYDVGQQSITMAGISGEEDYTQQGPEGAYSAVRSITSDGQVVYVDITVIYQLDKTQINDIHRSWRDTYEIGYVVPQARSQVRNVMTEYGAEEIYSGGRAQLESQIRDSLVESYAKEGLLLTDILIRNISFSQEFTDAIERKQIAQQDAQQAVFRVQQAEQEAEQARVEAQGRADSVVIAAEGDAEAIKIKADAEAQGLALINEILSENPQLIQYIYINQLGEKVRLILLPSNSPFLFDLQSLLEEAGIEPVGGNDLPTPTPEPGGDGDGN